LTHETTATRKEAIVFTELTEELLDLTATVKGAGDALYASERDEGGGCSCSCSWSLCCTV